MNILERILAKCGGANIKTLKKCPSETSKFVTVGITIIFTGIFAAFSGGYAFYKVFNKEVSIYEAKVRNASDTTKISTVQFSELNATTIDGEIIERRKVGIKHTFVKGSILMGLLWGFMIFNLDRFIVMSIKKRDNKWKEFITAIPRIILAIIISIVVAKPLEVRLFQDRIAAQISDNELLKREQNRTRINEITNKSVIDSLKENSQSRVSKLKAELRNECPTRECKDAFNAQKKALETYYQVKGKLQPIINDADKNIQFIKNSSKYKEITYVEGERKENLSEEGKRKLANYRSVFNTNIGKRQLEWSKYQSKLKTYNTLNKRYIESKKEELKEAESTDEDLSNQQKIATDLKLELEEKSDEAAEIAYTNNFITQLEALGDLTKWKFDKLDENGNILEEANNTMWYMNLAVIILFLTIETAPIFVKLISGKGQYDVALEAEDTKKEAEFIHDANTEIAVAEQKSQLQLQVLMNNQQAQLGMLQTAIQSWQTKKTQELNSGQLSDNEYKKKIRSILDFDIINYNPLNNSKRKRKSFLNKFLKTISKKLILKFKDMKTNKTVNSTS